MELGLGGGCCTYAWLCVVKCTQGRRKLPLLGQRLPPLFRRSCRNRSRIAIINAITSATDSTAAAAITAAIAADSAASASVDTTPPPPHSQCSPPLYLELPLPHLLHSPTWTQ
jgi:hypothetical protein